MTRTGKIARLPCDLRDELNHRLQDGEPGARILGWLNALPSVAALLAAEFGGVGLNAQNLSNWRQGGYQYWLKQQARRQSVRELTENAAELATDAGGVDLSHHLSAVLVAELAASARDALAAVADPAERCKRTKDVLDTLIRVRRQDTQAGQLALKRECWEKERRQDEYEQACRRENATRLRQLYRSFMTDSFARPDLFSQGQGIEHATTVLGGLKPGPSDPASAKSR